MILRKRNWALVLGVSLTLVCFGAECYRALYQRKIVDQLRHRGLIVLYDWQWDSKTQSPTQPGILRRVLGDDLLATVVLVSSAELCDEECRIIAQLPYVTDIETPISYSVTDVGLEQLGKLPHLRRLAILVSLKITDKGVSSLAKLERLESLSLSGNISERGLFLLSRVKSLLYLEVTSPLINDEGVLHFQQASALKSLELVGGNASTESVAAVRKSNPSLKFQYRPERRRDNPS